MAIVEMSKLRLVGLKSEQTKVMDTLARTHLFEPCPTAEIEGARKNRDTSHLDKVLAKQSKLSFAVKYLTDANDEAAKILKREKKQKLRLRGKRIRASCGLRRFGKTEFQKSGT